MPLPDAALRELKQARVRTALSGATRNANQLHRNHWRVVDIDTDRDICGVVFTSRASARAIRDEMSKETNRNLKVTKAVPKLKETKPLKAAENKE